ncbi:Kinesin-like protein Klp68D [Gryllus bimaculatus]|nr:Kinesin-like protein Klp68D [Gryllus bimaculatus]
MWSRKRMSVTYTPRSLKRPTSLFKRRISTVEKPSSNINVVVRVRPPNDKDSTTRQVVQVLDENCLVFDPKEDEGDFYVGGLKQLNRDMLKKRYKNLEFQFDKVFDQDSNNQEVFEGTTQNLISSLLDGFNCSVFVYGATGAGKTYTMLGNKETPGIAFLTMVELYKKMEEKSDHNFDLKISYLEVYNEMVKDLICPSGPLHLRDDGKDGTVISGIKTHRIESAEELFKMLEFGNRNRTQHPTDSNAESSRSHAVFQVHLCITHKLSVETKIAKLTMIDLAGSERGAATGGKGVRFSEGSNINKSLLALGNCVDALAEGHKHIPYRNSKLTRILKDSLGGNCKTVMIVNVAPSSIAYEETFNTLNYATRAKKISNRVRRNLMNVDMSVAQYKKVIEELKQRNLDLENEIQSLKEGKINQSDRKGFDSESCPDIAKGRQVLRCLYELEGKYRKELLMYQVKMKTTDWRIYQKQVISERFQIFEYMLGEGKSQSRVDDSIAKLKIQRKVYKEKVKSIQKLLKEKKNLREVALKDIKAKGLIEELQKDIDHFSGKMKENDFEMQVKYYKDLLLKQQHEMTNSDRIITQICKSMDYYYSVLNGSGKVTDQMKEEYLSLVQQLSGIKGVSWGDEPCEYTMLQKVMDLSFVSDDSRAECSPQKCDLGAKVVPEDVSFKNSACLSSPVKDASPPGDNYRVPSTPSVGLCRIAEYLSPDGDDCENVSPCKEQNPIQKAIPSLESSSKADFNKTFSVDPFLDCEDCIAKSVTRLETVHEETPNSVVLKHKVSSSALNTTFDSQTSECVNEEKTPENCSESSPDTLSLNTTFTKDTPSPGLSSNAICVNSSGRKDSSHSIQTCSSSVIKPKPQMIRSNLPKIRSASSSRSMVMSAGSCRKPSTTGFGRQPVTNSTLKDKLQVQPDKFKIRPGATIKIQYNVLSDKNKIVPKVPVSKSNSGLKNGSLQERNSLRTQLKENRTIETLKRNSPLISPRVRADILMTNEFRLAPVITQVKKICL